MTIIQTVEVPANRRVHLDFEVPREVPEGKTSIIMQFPDRKEAQDSKPSPKDGKLKLSRKEIDELRKDCPITERLTGILKGLVPSDITIEQIRDDRLAKYLK